MPASNFTAIVDRTEGDLVVLEMQYGHQLIVPAIYLPREIHDGAVIVFSASYDPEATKKTRQKAEDLQRDMHANKK